MKSPVVYPDAPSRPGTEPRPAGASDLVRSRFAHARRAQSSWAATPIARRLAVLRRFRSCLVERADEAADTVNRPAAETLSAQVLPLADACRFLEREAPAVLRPRRLGRRGRPAWLFGVDSEIHREPRGVVLIIAPGNYPLFLPGVQTLHALAAGNAVLLKPSPDGQRAAAWLAQSLQAAGLPPGLLAVLPSDVATAAAALAEGPDHVCLTGSIATGRQVLSGLAPRLIPCTLELSGCDAVIVRADADLGRTAAALAYGLRLNDGATCIAPRRVFVHREAAGEFYRLLESAIADLPPLEVPTTQHQKLIPLVNEALARGGRLLGKPSASEATPSGPWVVLHATPEMALLQADTFAPVMAIVEVADDEAALRGATQGPWALGASVFTRDARTARRLALAIPAGVVTINDLIVPTADPRVPFGGRRASGFGVTRGCEGLREFTVPKVIAARTNSWTPHLDPVQPDDPRLLTALLRSLHHPTAWGRLRAALDLMQVAWRRPSRAGGSSRAVSQPSLP